MCAYPKSITETILHLTFKGELFRKQVADWIGKSLSYVDARLGGSAEWSGEDVDLINKKAFELEIPEFRQRYLKQGERIVLDAISPYMLNGTMDDEVCDLLKLLTSARDGKITEEEKKRAHHLLDQAFLEVGK